MNIMDWIVIALGAVTVLAGYRKMASVNDEYRKSKREFAQVEEEQIQLKDVASKYSNLQDSYTLKRQELISLENRIARYEIGVGTVDESIFSRDSQPEDLPQLKSDLESVRDQIKHLVKDKQACICKLGDDVVVNNRKSEAKKLINREIKLRLRCFDNEAKAAMALADWNNINRLIERLTDAFDDINRRGEIIKVYLQSNYRNLKITELKLIYEISQLQQDVKDTEREQARLEREAKREEVRIIHAAAKAKADRERMDILIRKEVAKLAHLTSEQKEQLARFEEELEELKVKEQRATSMAQLTRSGYVYIISNPMSFGDGVIKIGMTRRVDPNERVRELGDASVPDTFDVHAFFYCDDAPALEKYLHKKFSKHQVNLVNFRKEFFFTEPDRVIREVEQSSFDVDRAA